MTDDRSPGWDTRALVFAAHAWGGLAECYDWHKWEKPKHMMMHIASNAVRTYGSVEAFVEAAIRHAAANPQE
jgi:hypothetical protein